MGRGDEDGSEVVRCIACGDTVRRSAAREYDRYGNRWDREDKRFEFLCTPCHRNECHLPRDGLEATLTEIETPQPSPAAFIGAYFDRVRQAADPGDGELS